MKKVIPSFAWGADAKEYIRPLPSQPPYEQLEARTLIQHLKGNTMSQSQYQDLYTQVAEEFNVERAFVKVISLEVMYSPNPNNTPLIDLVRAKVKHALELIDKSEES